MIDGKANTRRIRSQVADEVASVYGAPSSLDAVRVAVAWNETLVPEDGGQRLIGAGRGNRCRPGRTGNAR